MQRVAVVGAGIIGSTIAWRLGQQGFQVQVIEAGPFPGQASMAGAGMLAPGAEVCGLSPWSDLALESWRGYRDFTDELTRVSGRTIDYRECGAVEIARTPAEWAELQERAQRQAGMGIAARPLDPRELRAMVPALAVPVAGAIYYPRDAVVNPREIMAALGVLVKPIAAKTTTIESSAAGITIETSAGRIDADAAVLAAGAWSSDIAIRVDGEPYTPPAAEPVRGHLLAHELNRGLLGPILRHDHTYLFQRRTGHLIAGASQERTGFDLTLDPATIAALRERAVALIPSLLAGAPYEAWTGLRPGTHDGIPAIGRVGQSRLWLAYGHFRNGILMAPATARRITAELSASLGTP